MSKAGAGVILKALIGKEIDEDALPEGEEERVPEGVETIIGAIEVMGANGRRVETRADDGRWVKSEEEMIVIKDEPED